MRLLLLLLVAGFVACQSTESPSSQIQDVPALLDRPAAIQYGVEWDRIQNAYAQMKKRIQEGEEPLKNKLQMAQLFTMEARITGEHGHYYPAAQELLKSILAEKEVPDDLRFMTLTTLAGVQLSQHEFRQALESGSAAIALNSHNAQIHGVMVDAYVELGQYESAVKMADKMVSIRPDIRSYARVSYLREIHGQVDGAIEAMQMAVQAGLPGTEETSWAALQLGELLERYGYQKEAAEVYRGIIKERKDYPFAIANLASLEMEKGNTEEAEKLLKKACSIIPEVGFYQDLAALYQQTGREQEAQKLIQEVKVMLQDDVDSGHRMELEYADVYENLEKDLDKALEFALKAYQDRPENIDVNQLLARLYFKKEAYAKAEAHLKKAASTNSKDPDLLALQQELGQLSAAY